MDLILRKDWTAQMRNLKTSLDLFKVTTLKNINIQTILFSLLIFSTNFAHCVTLMFCLELFLDLPFDRKLQLSKYYYLWSIVFGDRSEKKFIGWVLVKISVKIFTFSCRKIAVQRYFYVLIINISSYAFGYKVFLNLGTVLAGLFCLV